MARPTRTQNRNQIVLTDGTTTWLEEGTAGHFTNDARRVEFHLGEEKLLTLEVDFAERGSVVERQQRPADTSTDL